MKPKYVWVLYSLAVDPAFNRPMEVYLSLAAARRGLATWLDREREELAIVRKREGEAL